MCSITAHRLILSGWDPFVEIPLRLLMAWAALMMAEPVRGRQMEQIWAKAVYAVTRRGNKIWQFVKGPITAVVATLLDMGWHEIGPASWLEPSGAIWDLKGDDLSMPRRELRQHLDGQQWKKVAAHTSGKGLDESGVLLEPVLKLRQQLSNSSKALNTSSSPPC